MQEAQIHAEVPLVLLLIRQLGVGNLIDVNLRLSRRCRRAPLVLGSVDAGGIRHPCRTRVGRQRVAGTKLQLRQPRLGLRHELLVDDIPCSRHVPRRQPTALVALAEAVGTFVAQRTVHSVALVEIVVELSVVGQRVCQRIGLTEILGVLLVHLLQPQVRRIGDAAVVILIAPTSPGVRGAEHR